jgi:DNA-binding response OmpR family regulator
MKKRILVIDDSEAILDVVKIALELVGCEVYTSLTSLGLQRMEPTLPDLILLDVLLSGESGEEICLRLKNDARTSHIPVILLSAHAGLQAAVERCSADDFLVKPFRLTELREKVEKHLAQPSSARYSP